jgi:FixJ family two-component response regulator
MAAPKPVVYVVDDSRSVRDALGWLFRSVKLPVRTFASAAAFLTAFRDDRPGCLVLDVRMPGMSGLELLEELKARDIALPVVVLTGHADVKMAVRAMKGGAFDFIEKPFVDQELLDIVQRAVQRSYASFGKRPNRREIAERLASLTSREREVLQLVVEGKTNKAISRKLRISVKTIEFHRAHMMRKMQARSVAELATEVASWRT